MGAAPASAHPRGMTLDTPTDNHETGNLVLGILRAALTFVVAMWLTAATIVAGIILVLMAASMITGPSVGVD